MITDFSAPEAETPIRCPMSREELDGKLMHAIADTVAFYASEGVSLDMPACAALFTMRQAMLARFGAHCELPNNKNLRNVLSDRGFKIFFVAASEVSRLEDASPEAADNAQVSAASLPAGQEEEKGAVQVVGGEEGTSSCLPQPSALAHKERVVAAAEAGGGRAAEEKKEGAALFAPSALSTPDILTAQESIGQTAEMKVEKDRHASPEADTPSVQGAFVDEVDLDDPQSLHNYLHKHNVWLGETVEDTVGELVRKSLHQLKRMERWHIDRLIALGIATYFDEQYARVLDLIRIEGHKRGLAVRPYNRYTPAERRWICNPKTPVKAVVGRYGLLEKTVESYRKQFAAHGDMYYSINKSRIERGLNPVRTRRHRKTRAKV